MAAERRNESGQVGGGWIGSGQGVVALAAALTAVGLVDSAYAAGRVKVERVAQGNARFTQNGSVLTIRAADRTIINYRQFDVGRGETVRFIQPTSSSRVLNRINSDAPSRIDGTIKANGIVYFVNPAGVMFGANSVVNVGQIYAAAGSISDANFINNVNQFKATGAVVNNGAINADAVALIGRTVANAGTISAEGGLVTMVAGDDVMVGTRDGHIMVKVGSTAGDGSSPAGGVTNTGSVRAASTTLAGGDLYALAIGGSVKSKRVSAQSGGDVAVTGTIDASDRTAGAKGGSVVVTGKNVTLTGATVDASGDAGGGSVLVGGDFQGKGLTPRAANTVVDNGTTITASAAGNGDGGKVVVWADNKTTYNGSIYAKGGSAGGNGGQVEVSGKGTLDFNGQVDTTAPKGKIGSLLLDPLNLSIEGSSPDVHGDGSNLDVTGDVAAGDDPGNNSVITAGQLVTLLDTTDVSLAATNDINVNVMVDASGNSGSHGLTLDAGHDVNVNAPILLNNADLTLNAGNRVYLPTTGGVNTNGGDVFINSGGDVVVEAGISPFLIQANNLTVEAATGIGAVTPLEIFLTGGLEAHSSVGDIKVHGTALTALNVGFVGGTKGGVVADDGNVTIDYDGGVRVETAGHSVVASADVLLRSLSGDVVTDNFNGSGAGQVNAGGQLTIQADGSVTIGATAAGDVHAGTGLSITATSGSVTIDNGSYAETDGGDITVNAGTSVELLQTITDQAHLWNNGAGTITVAAPSFVANSGGLPASLRAAGTVTVQADDVDFTDGIESGSSVVFRSMTTGRSISLADSAVVGQLTLTGAQLARVTAVDGVVIGDATAGDISIAGTINQPLSGWNTLHLITGGSISDAAGGTLQVDSLATESVTGTTLNNQTHFISTFAAVNTTSGGIALSNSGDLAVGTVDAVVGVQSPGTGAVSIETTGDLHIDGSGETVSAAGNISLSGQDVVTGGGNAPAVVSSGGSVTIDATRDVLIGSGDYGDVHAATGLTITATRHVIVDEGSVVDTDAGDISISGGTSVQFLQTNFSGAIVRNNGLGTLSIDTPSFSSASGALPGSVNAVGSVTIKADTVGFTDMITSADSVIFRPYTTGRSISLADSAVSGELTLTGAQLARVTAGNAVVIGDATSGNISIAGTITQPLSGWNALHLITGGSISDAAGGTLQVDALATSSVTGTTLNNQTHFVTMFAAVNTTSGGIALSNSGDLTVGTVDAVVGVQSPGTGAVSIETTGDLHIDGSGETVSAVGNISLAGQDVVTGGGNSPAVVSSGGSVTIDASRDVLIGSGSYGDIHAATGLTITAARDVIFDDGSIVDTDAGDISISGGTSVQFLQTNSSGAQLLNNGSGALTIAAPSFTSVSGGVPVAVQAGGLVTIQADTVDFTDGIESTGDSVVFKPFTAGRAISLADSAVSGELTLTGAQLARVSAANAVVIGDATSGNISIAGTINQPVSGWNTLHLITGGAISDAAGGTIQTDNLAVSAVTGVMLSNQTHFIGTFAARNATSGGIALTNGMALAIGTADGVTGVQALTAGGVQLTVTGTITVATNGATITAPGDVSLKAVGATADIVTGGQNALPGAAVRSTSGSVTLDAGRDVAIGQTDYGDVSGATGVTLTAVRDVTIDNGSFVEASGGNITVTAGSSVQLLQTSTDQAHLWNTGSGSITISAPSFVANSGGVPASVKTAGGAVTINADTVSFTDAIDAGAGVLTIAPLTAGRGIALADAPVSGKLTLTGADLARLTGSVIRIGNAAAGDISVAGTITQGTGWDTLSLITGGAISDAAGGTLQADHLALQADGAVDLSTQTHAIGTLAGAGGADFAVRSTISLTVGSVDGLNGVSATGTTEITSDHLLTLTKNVSGNVVNLSGDDGVTQSGGSITAGGLSVVSSNGAVSLTSAGNDVDTIAVVSNGPVAYVDADGFTVGTVNALNGITAHGNVSLTARGNVTIGKSISTGGGDLSITIAGGGLTALSSANISTTNASAGGNGGAVTIGASGAVDLSLGQLSTVGSANAGGAGGAGGNVLILAPSVKLGMVKTSGGNSTGGGGNGGAAGTVNVTASAGSITLADDVTATGGSPNGSGAAGANAAVAFHGPVVLADTVAVSGSTVTFDSTVQATTSGVQGLSIVNSGLATLGGAVGGGNKALASLDVSGPTKINGSSVTTTGTQAYHGLVTLGADTALVGNGITFSSTVDAMTDGGQALAIVGGTAGTTFAAPVGGIHSLASLAVTGPAKINGGSVMTAGGQTYNGAVILGANTTLTGTTIQLLSTVDGAFNLTLANSGLATFGGAVGATTPLANLLVAGNAAINGGSIKTTGNQTYAGPISLGADATLDGANLSLAPVTGNGHDLTLHGTGTTSLVTVTNVGALTSDFGGTTTFAGTVSAASVLVTDTLALNGGAVTTTGTQTYQGAVTLGTDTTLTGSTVRFDQTLQGLTDGGQKLTLNGNAQFASAVGGAGHRLKSLSVSGTTLISGVGGSAVTVTTTGAQTYAGAVTLGSDGTLTTNAAVTFGSTLNSNATGQHALTISADSLSVAGRVGAAHPLGSMTVTTTGNQTYSAAVILGGSSTFRAGSAAFTYSTGGKLVPNVKPGSITFNKELTTAGDVLVYGSAGVTFKGEVRGTNAHTDTLTVQVPWLSQDNPAMIVFAAPASSRADVRRLKALRLENPLNASLNAADQVPHVATIAATSKDGFTVEVTDEFTMGKNQKLTATNGSLKITVADGTASVGDLNAPGDVIVHARTVKLMQRAGGGILLHDGTLIADDRGLNFVAGGDLDFDSPAGQTFTFVETVKGALVGFNFVNDFPSKANVQKLGGNNGLLLNLSNPVLPEELVFDGRVLDVGLGGTSIVDPSVVRAAASHVQTIRPTEEIGISAIDRAALAAIGVRTREATHAELIDGLDGREMYVQVPEPLLQVAIPRLRKQAVDGLTEKFNALFLKSTSGEVDTGAVRADMQNVLTAALEAYKAGHPGDVEPVTFRRFLEGAPEWKQAVQYMNGLRDLMSQVEILGLTAKEMDDVKAQLFGLVKPSGMSLETFLEAVMAR